MVTLEPITRDNLRAVVKLTVGDDQNGFVATNVYSVAQAYVEPTWTPLAIVAEGEPVGFVMVGRETDSGRDWIIRLMVDKAHQGKGYGKAGILAAIERLRATPGNTEILLSYVPGNAHAERLYRHVGFEPTGEVDDGEIVMRLG